MADDDVFRACMICDSIRAEPNGKATILGLLGLAPLVEIVIPNPHIPVSDLSFVLFSNRLTTLKSYRIGLSIKDPSGTLMFPMAEQETTLDEPQILNIAFSFRPFSLNGPGKYELFTLVNNKPDFATSFTVKGAEPGQST